MAKKLKIFIVMSGSATAISDSEIMYLNILDSLKELGHDLTHYDFGLKWSAIKGSNEEEKKEHLTTDILKELNSGDGYDLFLSFLTDLFVEPRLYLELKKICPTVNWTCNSHQFDILHKKISPHVDLNTFITLDHKNLYDSVDAKSYWMPMAANPNFYKNNDEKDIDISFMGTSYGKRPYYIWRLLQSSLDVNVHGYGWKFGYSLKDFIKIYAYPTLISFMNDDKKLGHIEANTRMNILRLINKKYKIGNPLSDIQYANRLSRSKITLNFPEARVNHNYMSPEMIWGVNFRDFEAPMSGALLITQFSKELENFYEDDKEVISFRNEHELIDKCKFYKKNDKARSLIANAGYERARSEHTWENRFTKLFDYLDDMFNIYSS